MADELSAPLLRRRDRAAARRAQTPPKAGFRIPFARIAIAGIVVILGAVVLRLVLVDDPMGGRPSAEASITRTGPDAPMAESSGPAAGGATITAGPETSIPLAGGPSFTTLDDSVATADSFAGDYEPPAATDADLAEATEDGPIPRIAPDGTTPFAAYARPSVTLGATGGKPVIAIVVTGLGLSERGTLDAIAKLPDTVTLAFAPYGKSLDRTVAAARAEGHELLLEIPLEPFDYPENDPGPQTLLTGAAPRANLDKLFWLMTRFQGYAGLINHMGARFTASGGDFAPIMEEIASRGLGYLDDGSSNRSLAAQLAAAGNVPYARAEVQLDNNPAREPILAELAALEAKAAESGSAIGLIAALPVSIDVIAEWAKTLEGRGILLVPASVMMKGP